MTTVIPIAVPTAVPTVIPAAPPLAFPFPLPAPAGPPPAWPAAHAGGTPPAGLYVGDCRAVLADLPAGDVDLAVTDPPYNFGLSYHGRYDDRQPTAAFLAMLEAAMREVYRVLTRSTASSPRPAACSASWGPTSRPRSSSS